MGSWSGTRRRGGRRSRHPPQRRPLHGDRRDRRDLGDASGVCRRRFVSPQMRSGRHWPATRPNEARPCVLRANTREHGNPCNRPSPPRGLLPVTVLSRRERSPAEGRGSPTIAVAGDEGPRRTRTLSDAIGVWRRGASAFPWSSFTGAHPLLTAWPTVRQGVDCDGMTAGRGHRQRDRPASGRTAVRKGVA
jgi:hypothetical protein